MYIKKILIKNFRGIHKMELELHPKLNVFIGNNGAGKSSVLEMIAMIFSRSPIFSDGNTLPIKYSDIRKGTNHIFAGLYCEMFKEEYLLNMHYSETNQTSETEPAFGNIAAQRKREIVVDHNVSLNFPLVVYYPANRTISDVSERIHRFHPAVNQLDALEGTLDNALDFRSFFDRIRECFYSSNNNNEIFQDSFSKRFCSQKKAIQNAVVGVLDGFSSLRVEKKSRSLVVDKNGNSLEISQLSDGEKCLIAVVGDLSQRLAIANPSLENPLEGEGIVLIDEIDLHLHPQWQRMILPKLTEIFPNCQFIVSTHSPQILGEIRSENIICLQDGENGIEAFPPSYETFGQTSEVILPDIMETKNRNEFVEKQLDRIFEAIDNGNLTEAKNLKNELETKAKDIPEYAKIELLIHRKEKLGK
ncbi:MAG: AAA family ATPase [Planctomycetaceae bacterium]|jgi:predicted ATP-binding protein involved in virulence|nr:AAA family ATPase [Planctomycetaceae bacterium]